MAALGNDGVIRDIVKANVATKAGVGSRAHVVLLVVLTFGRGV